MSQFGISILFEINHVRKLKKSDSLIIETVKNKSAFFDLFFSDQFVISDLSDLNKIVFRSS